MRTAEKARRDVEGKTDGHVVIIKSCVNMLLVPGRNAIICHLVENKNCSKFWELVYDTQWIVFTIPNG